MVIGEGKIDRARGVGAQSAVGRLLNHTKGQRTAIHIGTTEIIRYGYIFGSALFERVRHGRVVHGQVRDGDSCDARLENAVPHFEGEAVRAVVIQGRCVLQIRRGAIQRPVRRQCFDNELIRITVLVETAQGDVRRGVFPIGDCLREGDGRMIFAIDRHRHVIVRRQLRVTRREPQNVDAVERERDGRVRARWGGEQHIGWPTYERPLHAHGRSSRQSIIGYASRKNGTRWQSNGLVWTSIDNGRLVRHCGAGAVPEIHARQIQVPSAQMHTAANQCAARNGVSRA